MPNINKNCIGVLQSLAEARVLKVEKTGNGLFRFYEECDNYFSKTLTKEQVFSLAEELKLLACDEKST